LRPILFSDFVFIIQYILTLFRKYCFVGCSQSAIHKEQSNERAART